MEPISHVLETAQLSDRHRVGVCWPGRSSTAAMELQVNYNSIEMEWN